MLVTIGAKPPADFSQPLQMLKDCHRRIEYFLDLLRRVEQQCGEGVLPDEGRRALESAVSYFAEFAPRHTADEEKSLFPRMRGSSSPEAHAVLAEMERLEADHRACEEAHAVVDRIVRQWMADRRITPEQRALLHATLATLAKIYAAHIDLEERQVFEVASRTLTADDLRGIGREMRQRRALETR